MSYLLTKQEQEELYCKYVDADDDVYVKAIAKAQDRKSRRVQLEQLEKEGLLRHDAKIVAEPTGRGFVNLSICREDCRACAALREVGA